MTNIFKFLLCITHAYNLGPYIGGVKRPIRGFATTESTSITVFVSRFDLFLFF